jgi:hypothetical protein
MMNINEAKLNAYLDGELSETEREVVERHLANSPQTQMMLTKLRWEAEQMRHALNALAPTKHPPSPAWLALKRLKARTRSNSQMRESQKSVFSENVSSMVWESPAPLTEIKTFFKEFQIDWRKLMWNKFTLVTGIGLITAVVFIVAILWLNTDSVEPYTSQPQPATPGERIITATAIPLLPDDPLPEGTGKISSFLITILAVFNDEIELAYRLSNEPATHEDGFDLILYWRGLRPIETDYVVFIHIVDANGQLVSQYDTPPAQGTMPTGSWLPDKIIEDHYDITALAQGLPPGKYDVVVGMYNTTTGERLPVRLESEVAPDASIPFMQISVSNGKVTPIMPAFVALQPISQGSELTPGSIDRRELSAFHIPPLAILDEAELIGRIAKYDIVEGQIIVRPMLMETAEP